MDGPTDRSKRHTPKRDSDRGDEGKRADPPKVKLEERPDNDKREAHKRYVEEGARIETRRTTAVAAPQKDPVIDKAACPGKKAEPTDSSSEDGAYLEVSDVSVTFCFARKTKPCHWEPTSSLFDGWR